MSFFVPEKEESVENKKEMKLVHFQYGIGNAENFRMRRRKDEV